jgi:hypothetical protein
MFVNVSIHIFWVGDASNSCVSLELDDETRR